MSTEGRGGECLAAEGAAFVFGGAVFGSRLVSILARIVHAVNRALGRLRSETGE